jgi:predicted kinase
VADRSPLPPVLAVVCGLPGVGKSTVARAIADRLPATVFRTDVIRKELYAEPAYTTAETVTVYDELLTRAFDHLEIGESVVLDATFKTGDRRIQARDLATQVGARFRLVHVECQEAVLKRRIEARDGVSDADLDVHIAFRDRFEPVEMDHVVVDNSGSAAATEDRVARAFGDLTGDRANCSSR